MSDRNLERELPRLADSAFPETPSLVDSVLAAIAIEAPRRRPAGSGGTSGRRCGTGRVRAGGTGDCRSAGAGAYVADAAGGMVSLVYRNADESPGLVITQFRSQGTVAVKQLTDGASAFEITIVNDVRGYWIEGSHTIAFYGEAGEILSDLARLVGDTLVWQEGEITFRLESALGRESAVELARRFVGS